MDQDQFNKCKDDLVRMGFKESYTHSDDEIEYTVLNRGYITITLNHTDNTCFFDIDTGDSENPISNMLDLHVISIFLDRLINTKISTREIFTADVNG